MQVTDNDLLNLQNEDKGKEQENNVSDFDKMFQDIVDEDEASEQEQTPEEEKTTETTEEEPTKEEEKPTNSEEEEPAKEEEEPTKEEDNSDTTEKETEGSEDKEKETEEGEFKELLDDILEEAEAIWWEEVDKAAEAVQDSVDKWEDEDIILQRITELEDALNQTTMEKDSYKKEKEMLLNKLNDLQDKLSEYEIKWYEYNAIEKALDKDPTLKWFVKVLAIHEINPDKVPKERIIDAIDWYVYNEFGVGIKDLLSKKAEEQKKVMTSWDWKQPIEITIGQDDKDPLDKMLGI